MEKKLLHAATELLTVFLSLQRESPDSASTF